MPDDTFKEFVLDQLGALPELRATCAKELQIADKKTLSQYEQ